MKTNHTQSGESELLKAVDNLPKWLRETAQLLEYRANTSGNTSVIAPKLNWYADRIEAAIKNATGEKEEVK